MCGAAGRCDFYCAAATNMIVSTVVVGFYFAMFLDVGQAKIDTLSTSVEKEGIYRII